MEKKQFINTGNKDTRSGFGAGLSVIGDENPNVVAMCADLTGSLKMDAFAKAHPDRFYQAGIAEANMIGVGAGMALSGKIPFVGSFAAFATGAYSAFKRKSIEKPSLSVTTTRFPLHSTVVVLVNPDASNCVGILTTASAPVV